jgi:hypothetical protein
MSVAFVPRSERVPKSACRKKLRPSPMLEVHFADQPRILARHYRSLGTTTAREEELIRFSHGPHSKLAMPTGAARYCLMTAPGQGRLSSLG